MSLSELAVLKGFTPSHLRRLISEGKLKAEKVGYSWVVAQKDAATLTRRRAPNKD